MIAHQMAAGSSQGFLNRGNLQENVSAISLLLHHLFQASYLTGDACEPPQRSCLDLRIDLCGLALISAGTVGCSCFGSGLFVRAHGLKLRSLRLLLNTLTELRAMAALAITGLRRMPSTG